MKRRHALAAALGLASSILSIGDVGCGSTGGGRFVFDARAGGIERDGAQPLTFTNPLGWTITLTKANVTFGPVYLNVIAPLRKTALLSLGRIARAEDAHLGEGRLVGEVLGRVTIDALSPALVPFAAQGTMTQEEVRTAEVWLWPPEGTDPNTKAITTPAFEVAGEAHRGDEHVRFRGALVLDDTWTRGGPGDKAWQPIAEVRKVRGIATTFFPEQGGALEIRVDVRPLFAGANFAALSENPADDDGTKILVQGKSAKRVTDQVMENVWGGLRASAGTYSVRWVLP